MMSPAKAFRTFSSRGSSRALFGTSTWGLLVLPGPWREEGCRIWPRRTLWRRPQWSWRSSPLRSVSLPRGAESSGAWRTPRPPACGSSGLSRTSRDFRKSSSLSSTCASTTCHTNNLPPSSQMFQPYAGWRRSVLGVALIASDRVKSEPWELMEYGVHSVKPKQREHIRFLYAHDGPLSFFQIAPSSGRGPQPSFVDQWGEALAALVGQRRRQAAHEQVEGKDSGDTEDHLRGEAYIRERRLSFRKHRPVWGV